ncbi:hypothetical protein KKG36_01695 [Patescibacteria group bacterium]|nr:hypothetical protein [Patescibacteria group bacterium]
MNYQKLLKWELLIPLGLVVYLLTWVVQLFLLITRTLALVVLAMGIALLIISLFKKNDVKKVDAKEVK